MTTGDHVDELQAARAAILGRIAEACDRVRRAPTDVTLVAVTKTIDSSRLRDAVAAGLTTFGENRVQEGAAKAPEVPGATWHLIGPLQSNKARRAIEVFDTIESVDSIDLAERLDRLAREVRGAGPHARYPVLLQVNVDDDAAKAGLRTGELAATLRAIARLEALEVRGLMTIGRLVRDAEAARSTFQALRQVSDTLRGDPAIGQTLGPALSMGMSDDFEVAIEEGATIVRVGRAIFGERHVH